jgi:hypothetical protein
MNDEEIVRCRIAVRRVIYAVIGLEVLLCSCFPDTRKADGLFSARQLLTDWRGAECRRPSRLHSGVPTDFTETVELLDTNSHTWQAMIVGACCRF